MRFIHSPFQASGSLVCTRRRGSYYLLYRVHSGYAGVMGVVGARLFPYIVRCAFAHTPLIAALCVAFKGKEQQRAPYGTATSGQIISFVHARTAINPLSQKAPADGAKTRNSWPLQVNWNCSQVQSTIFYYVWLQISCFRIPTLKKNLKFNSYYLKIKTEIFLSKQLWYHKLIIKFHNSKLETIVTALNYKWLLQKIVTLIAKNPW